MDILLIFSCHIFYFQIKFETDFCRNGRVARIQLKKAMGAQNYQKKSCGIFLLRYTHTILNTILAIIGVLKIFCGMISWEVLLERKANIFLLPITLIALGSVYVLISFLGCCVSIRESFCLTMSYVVALLILFILLSAGMTYNKVLENSIDTESPAGTSVFLYGTEALMLLDVVTIVIAAFLAFSLRDDMATKRNGYLNP